MKFVQEFKAFISHGNVIDLAVGVVVGGAFGAIVTSFVNDMISPLLGLLLSHVNLKEFAWTLRPASNGVPATMLMIGSFLQACINFLIISFVVFVAIKLISRFQTKEKVTAPTPTAPTEEAVLLKEIRDLLKKSTTPSK